MLFFINKNNKYNKLEDRGGGGWGIYIKDSKIIERVYCFQSRGNSIYKPIIIRNL